MWQNWNGGTIKLGTTKGLFHVYSVVVYAFVLQEHVRLLFGFLSFTQFTVIYSRGIQFLNFHCRWLWCLKVFSCAVLWDWSKCNSKDTSALRSLSASEFCFTHWLPPLFYCKKAFFWLRHFEDCYSAVKSLIRRSILCTYWISGSSFISFPLMQRLW